MVIGVANQCDKARQLYLLRYQVVFFFTMTAMVQIYYNNFANNLQAIKMPYMVYITIVYDYSCVTEIYFHVNNTLHFPWWR